MVDILILKKFTSGILIIINRNKITNIYLSTVKNQLVVLSSDFICLFSFPSYNLIFKFEKKYHSVFFINYATLPGEERLTYKYLERTLSKSVFWKSKSKLDYHKSTAPDLDSILVCYNTMFANLLQLLG